MSLRTVATRMDTGSVGPVGSRDGPLFEPFRLNGCLLLNRVAMAPMTRMFAESGVNPPSTIEYYRRRAEGGAGLILTEGIATSALGAQNAQVPHLSPGPAQERWAEVTRAVHDAGGKIFAQLWHAGLGRFPEQSADPRTMSIGPNGIYLVDQDLIASGGTHQPGRAMDDKDLDGTIAEHAAAAENAVAAGFDGIEVHSAHGYLLDQFLWAKSNRRDDDYGGSIVARSRFVAEVVSEIRRRVGPALPIGLRFSQWKSPQHYGVRTWESPGELEQALSPIVEAGVDYFHASTRRYWETEFGSDLTLAGWAKKLTARPAVLVGSVGTNGAVDPMNLLVDSASQLNLPHVESYVASGEVDLVAVGRGMLANPDWVNRVQRGEIASLRPYAKDTLFSHA